MLARHVLLSLGLLLGAFEVRAQGTDTGLSLVSPFEGEGAVAPSGPREPTDYEFVGSLKAGEETMIGILNKSTQKSFWISPGRTIDGFELVSRTAKGDEVVARYGGAMHTLKLKEPTFSKTAVVAYAPPPAAPKPPGQIVPARPLPQPKSGAPSTPQQQVNAEQEKEARMLVSDLLEIGAQQRKAYEEAQKRKAAGQTTPLPTAK